MIQDRARQAVVLNENERVTDGRGHCGGGARLLQSCSDIYGDQKLVLNNEDRTDTL
jgi:hypothetical protein